MKTKENAEPKNEQTDFFVNNVEEIVKKIKSLSKQEKFDFYIQCFTDIDLYNIINGAVQYDK